jgi:hypothetical protein
MMNMPSVGRIVHYRSYGTPGGEYPSVCRAAIVTEADSSEGVTDVGLCVLNPEGMFFNRDVPHAHADQPAGGTWHWPERVPAPDLRAHAGLTLPCYICDGPCRVDIG